MTVDLDSRNILDILPCYLTIQDSTLHIIYNNQAFIKDFGDGVGQLCHMAWKKSPNRCDQCPVQKTFQSKKAHFSEETVRTNRGKTYHIAVHSSPVLDETGNVSAVIELAANVSQIMKAQKELVTLGSSMSILSHSIKNILEGLQGGAYVVDEGVKDDDMSLAKKGWDIVKKNITDIVDVSQNVLYASKRRRLQFEKTLPQDAARDSFNTFKEKAFSLGVDLRLETNPDLPPVNLDPLSIRRMLNNFIWNAIEACTKDGKPSPHVVVIRMDLYDESHFMIEIEDNGIGMDFKTKEKIFKQFFSTKGCGGTGLGLSVADTIIKQHGGVREVDSTPGKGSTFRVILNS